MSEWLSIKTLSSGLDIPEQSLRRYVTAHSPYLNIRKEHRSYQIHEDSEKTLKLIRKMYKNGKTSDEIDKHLATTGIPTTIEMPDETGAMAEVDVKGVMVDIKKALHNQGEVNANQMEFNKQFVALLEQQNREIASLKDVIEKKDEQLLLALKEKEEVQKADNTEVISWWKRLFG